MAKHAKHAKASKFPSFGKKAAEEAVAPRGKHAAGQQADAAVEESEAPAFDDFEGAFEDASEGAYEKAPEGAYEEPQEDAFGYEPEAADDDVFAAVADGDFGTFDPCEPAGASYEDSFDETCELAVTDSVNGPFDMPESKAKSHKVAKIAVASVFGVLAAAYFIGVAVFSFLFFPNTTIGENDISLKSKSDMETMLNSAVANYAFTVEGQGVSLSMTAQEAGISIDSEEVISGMRSRVNAWAWPYEVFQSRDMADCMFVEYVNTALEDNLRAACATINETATPPTDATIGYSAEVDTIAVIPEQYGTLIDADEVVAYVQKQNDALALQIVLPDEVLVEADLRKDDERLARAAKAANEFMTADVDLMMGGQIVAAVNAESMIKWVVMDENFQVSMSDELMVKWIQETAEACSTIGDERVYTRPDGKEVTVSGGDYGWDVDDAAFEQLVRDAVANKQQGQVDMPLYQEAQAYNGPGNADWGKRYVDVDLAEQHAYFYNENGEVIWETDIVSGGPGSSRATPSGVWDLNTNNGYSMLVGRKPDGSIDYETPVSYWMPFVGQAIGLHDANWRGSFGGSIYSYDGSHGCINLPVSKARELHELIQVGDVVITHW